MIIRARYAMLEPGRVLRDVRLEIDSQRISVVRSGFTRGAAQPDYDFGLALITPGLVNTHAHLELEFCRGRAPYRGSFIRWLQDVRDLKRDQPQQVTRFPAATLRHLRSQGCTCVLDHHTVDMDWPSIRGMGLRYVPFREYFMFNNHAPDLERMREQAQFSYAPHSSYTASLEVALACRQLADEAGRPMSVHLSEFPAELEFIRDGSNAEVEELLRLAGALDPQFRGTGLSPIAHYAASGLLSPATYMVHGNYHARGDLKLLSEIRPTVVYCPYSHHFFGHPAHPLPDYHAAGIPVAIGTDSLASNDEISPLREAALARRALPQVPAEEIFAALTTHPLAPLGWDRHLGRLEPGFLADFAVFRLPADPGADFTALLDALLATQDCLLTVCDGRLIHGAERDSAAA